MKQIEIAYRKYFLRIPLKMRRFTIDIPQSWDELAAPQLIAFCKEDNLDELVLSLLGKYARKSSPFRAGVGNLVNIAQRNDILNELKFMTERPVMVKWIMPGKGPGNKLSNLSLMQYGKCEALYQAYVDDQTDRNLDALINAIYNGHEPRNAKPETRKAILINYIAVHNYIIDQSPNLYPKPQHGDVPSGEGTNWLRIADEMAGDKIGTIDHVLQMPCIAALQILEDRAERLSEQKRSSDPVNNIFNKRNQEQHQD